MAALVVAASCLVLGPAAGAGAGAPAPSWPAYLGGPTHASDATTATAVTPADAGHLRLGWTFDAGPPPFKGLTSGWISSPTVANGVIFIGSDNGTFYAVNQKTGTVRWSRFVGYVKATTCGSRGFAATATVAPDPVTGVETVYVSGPDGYLYALDAATGAVVWRSVIGLPSSTQNDYFDWSSPTVANGSVYVGISSQCDVPLVPAGLLQFNQATGVELNEFHTEAPGVAGGSIWSSAAVGPSGTVYVATGNGSKASQFAGYGDSVVALNGLTLAVTGSWQIPPAQAGGNDSDFGGSPTLFQAVLPGTTGETPMIGACNKNGVYYALRRNDLAAGPVWSVQVGQPPGPTSNAECVAAAAWNGTSLFVAGPATTIDGTSYNGSIQALNPATGAVEWATGLPGAVDGSPSVDGAGVLSVDTFDFTGAPNADYLVAASNGAVLATVSTRDSPAFSQPVFVGSELLLGTLGAGLLAYDAAPG